MTQPARARLAQMRELAARFSADKTTRMGETRALRLLPQPVYRYEAGKTEFLDGALFAFVEATDPEVFLLLEARPSGTKFQWHYARGMVEYRPTTTRYRRGGWS